MMDGQGEVAVVPRSPFASSGGNNRDSVGSAEHSLHSRTSSSTRRKSAWKRVSQLYSPRQSSGAAADDDLDDGGLWDNNDQDFHRQVALESKEDLSSQVHVFASASANASMEEVCSPGEQRRSFLDTTRTPSVGTAGVKSAATSSTTSLPVSSMSTQPLLLATPTSELSLASNDYAPPQRLLPALAPTDPQRPASAGGNSLYTSRSYSTVCSETSSALTYPSPGSSKVELHARHRLSNPQQQKRLSNGKDASPTVASFGALARQHSALDTTGLPPPHASPLPPAQHAIQLSGWTQEQIQSPPASGEHRAGSFQSLAHAPLNAATVSSSHWTADYATPPVAMQATPSQERRRLTAAESVRDQALHDLKQRRPSAQQLGEWQESSDTMVNSASSNSNYDRAPPTATSFPVTYPASPTKSHSTSNDPAGLLSGLKKMLRVKKTSNKSALPPPAPSARADVRPHAVSGNDIDTPAPYDGQRRPSLPHVGTAPTIPKTRRLSMQVAQAQEPPRWSTIDSHAVSAALDKANCSDSASTHGLPPAQRRRRPSADTFVHRLLGQSNASPSRNSIIEHTSFDEAKRRSGVWSTMQDPSESLYRSSSLVKAAAPPTASSSYATPDDAQEELQGESDGVQSSDSDVRSLSSIRSAPHILPHRPPRHDEGETQSRPALDPFATTQRKRRPSIESMFNSAHDRRWSAAVGHSNVGGTDAADPAQNTTSIASPSSSLLSLSESGGGGVPATLSRVDSNANSVMSNDGASSVVSYNGNGHASPESALGPRHQRRRSSVETNGNTLASLIKSSLPLARKGSVSSAIISRPLELEGARSEDALLAGLDMLDSTATTRSNRHSGSSDECLTPLGGDPTTRRPSRSTNDLPNAGVAPPMHRSASNQSLSSRSVGAVPKRPTFGLELQPDAAAAFDSIPLPATPDKRRSRSLSTSNEPFGQSSSMDAHARSGSSSSLANRRSLLLSASDDFVHTGDTPTTVPADLPSDVEDVEDLLDMDGDQTLTEDFGPMPSSDATLAVAPGVDEMELLHEGVAPKGPNEQAWTTGEDQSGMSSAPSNNVEYASLTSYRFPAAAPSMAATDMAPAFESLDSTDKMAAPVPSQLARRVSSFTHPAGLPPPPPPAKLVAAHLRRPSSSTSYV